MIFLKLFLFLIISCLDDLNNALTEMNHSEIGSSDQCRSINNEFGLNATNTMNSKQNDEKNSFLNNSKTHQIVEEENLNNSSIDNQPKFECNNQKNNIINNRVEERTQICDRCYLSKRPKQLSIFTGKLFLKLFLELFL